MTDEELLQAIAAQYKTVVQMNRLLASMIEEARDRNLVREIFQQYMQLQEEEGVTPQDRPPVII